MQTLEKTKIPQGQTRSENREQTWGGHVQIVQILLKVWFSTMTLIVG